MLALWAAGKSKASHQSTCLCYVIPAWLSVALTVSMARKNCSFDLITHSTSFPLMASSLLQLFLLRVQVQHLCLPSQGICFLVLFCFKRVKCKYSFCVHEKSETLRDFSLHNERNFSLPCPVVTAAKWIFWHLFSFCLLQSSALVRPCSN